MKRLLKLLLAALLVILVAAAGLGFYLHLIFSQEMVACGEDLISESESPDGKHVAVVFLRNCGATTAYVTHVNVRSSDEVFSADSDGVIAQGEIFVREGNEKVTIEWTEEVLSIEYDGERVMRPYQ